MVFIDPTVSRHLGRCAGGQRKIAATSSSADGHQAEPGPGAALLALEQPGLDEHLEVVRHRGLGQPDEGGEVADAGLAGLRGADRAEQLQAHRVGHGLEQGRAGLGRLAASAHRRRRCRSRPARRDGERVVDGMRWILPNIDERRCLVVDCAATHR